MKNWIAALAVGALAAGVAAPAAAQDIPLAFEVRLDAGIPVDDSGDLYETGVGFGVRASLDVAPTFAIYGGYSQFTFELDDELVGDDENEVSGFELGGRVGVGSGHGSGSPYVLLGALFHEDETGIEAGLGADYAVSWQVSVTPEVRYRKVDELTYLTLGLGARFRF
jgi:opacity protein-like surface antigen